MSAAASSIGAATRPQRIPRMTSRRVGGSPGMRDAARKRSMRDASLRLKWADAGTSGTRRPRASTILIPATVPVVAHALAAA